MRIMHMSIQVPLAPQSRSVLTRFSRKRWRVGCTPPPPPKLVVRPLPLHTHKYTTYANAYDAYPSRKCLSRHRAQSHSAPTRANAGV